MFVSEPDRSSSRQFERHGEVHKPLGRGRGGRGEVREDRELRGEAAPGRHPPPGSLPHARHAQPQLQELSKDSGIMNVGKSEIL